MDFAKLTIILPTFNEAHSIEEMVQSLLVTYPGVRLLIVDDGSTDGTAGLVDRLALSHARLLDRRQQADRGLCASVLEGIQAVATPYFLVMDADGQHPVEGVAKIASGLESGLDLVVASRTSIEDEWSRGRRVISLLGTALGKMTLWLRGKSWPRYDVLSGYFGCRTTYWRQVVERAESKRVFEPQGYKVLFDFLKQLPRGAAVGQVGYHFHTRQADVSKIHWRVYWHFIRACFVS